MSAKPKTYQADLRKLPAALEPLTQQDRWVVWSWEERTRKDGTSKWTKPPFDARSPRDNARTNDPSTWASYFDAVKAVEAGNADGIGFMLLGSDVGAGDLDHARDISSGTIEPWAQQLTAETNGAYIETTVSGTGLRAIGRANGPEVHRKFTFNRETGAAVELYRNTARYITISGLEIGSCPELPPFDDFIDTVFARFTGTATPASSSGRLDLNTAGPQHSTTPDDYENIIRNGAPVGNRSDLFQAVVWHLANRGKSINEIVEELAKHPDGIGQKYANRLHKEVTRSYDKWRARKHAAVGSIGGSGSSSTMWRQIYIRSGELPRIINEAEIALLELNAEIYQRGGMMVRPVISTLKASDDRNTRVWNLIQVTAPYLVENLTRAAQFFRWDGRAKNYVVTDAPNKIADTYLSRQGEWKLPVLTGVVNTPFLRADGSICEQPGYDEATGLLFKPGDETFPSIPQFPGKNDALETLKVIDRLITTFPFVTETDRSVMLGAMLTALDRRSMSTAPLHAFSAPVQGSGKSLLVDIAAALATGQPAPVISQGRSEEELEKRLGAALIQGDAIISIDNCEYPLQSSFLCQVLTQQRLNIRLLGHSRHVEVPANAALFATGNNLVIAGDLIRRTLLCSIDPQCERPEQRRFDDDPIAVIQANRGALVAAALTVLRAWHMSNDRVEVPPFGPFDEWSYRVREPLIWLGHTDPCDTVTKVRDTDPYRSMHSAVLLQWKEQLGITNAFTVREIIEVAVNSADFHGALLAVSADKGGHTVSNDRLGRWLKKVEGKILDGLMLKQESIVNGYPKWRLMLG
jgi:hypothetical protein